MKTKIYNGYFKKINSSNVAYWFGFITGDGSIGIYNKSKKFDINLKREDKYHLEKLASIIGYPIERVKNRKNKRGYETSDLQITCKELYDDLYNIGLRQRKSYILDKNIIPSNFKFDFIRGLFDADGTIIFIDRKGKGRYGKQAIIGLYGNYPLLEEIQKILNSGGHLMENKIKNGRADSLLYGGRFKVEKIGKRLYKNAKIYLHRKKNIFDKISSYNQEHKGEERLNRKYSKYINGRAYVKLICENCGKEYWTRSDHIGNYCSRECANTREGINKGRFKKGHLPYKGIEKTQFRKGYIPWNKKNRRRQQCH